MTVSELISQINLETDELLDSDEENLQYINDALDLIGYFLAGMAAHEVTSTTNIKDNDPVPDNFTDFQPHNGYPVYVSDGHFKLLDPDDYRIEGVRYTHALSHVSNMTDTLPMPDAYGSCLCFVASYLIKKKIMMPIESCQQDKAFVEELMSAIKAAKGGAPA